MLIRLGPQGLSLLFPRITGRPLAKFPSGMSGAEVGEKHVHYASILIRLGSGSSDDFSIF